MGGFERDASAGDGQGAAGCRVSGTTHNEVLNTVVIVPASSIAPEIWPLRLGIGRFAGKDSYAVVPGIRQVRKGRLRGTLGELSHEKLAALDECLEAYLC
ncbi:MAG: type II toxin-antitoxin system PemK/MazF family toxin [Lacunisphaera sp.]